MLCLQLSVLAQVPDGYNEFKYQNGKTSSEGFMENGKPNGYWTLKNCKEESSKYGSQQEWIEKSCGSYAAARRNGWLSECKKHMKK